MAPIANAEPDPLLPYGTNPQTSQSIGAQVDGHDEIDTSDGNVDLPF